MNFFRLGSFVREAMHAAKQVLISCLGLLIPVLSYAAEGEWPVYGGDAGGQRYSPLKLINAANVTSLEVAWSFHTGDAYQPKKKNATWFEATPLYVDGRLFLSTPLGKVFAVDPLTGKEIWSYDAKVNRDAGYGDFASRGVSTWQPADGKRRIFAVTIDARLIALDATTGKPVGDFGDNGEVNLRNGLRIPIRDYPSYEETSPPAIVGDTIVVGSAVADNGSTSQPSGEVRGFNAQTGKLKWKWDPIPQDPKAPGANTWKNGSAAKTGAANAWSIIVADPARGLVFLPIGSASPDYFGGERKGWNMYANSVVCLRAETGEFVWGFQTVHHDLWDYDVASPPMLFDVHRNGKLIPAVAVGSKTGHVFILDRETGKPIFGVNEKPVPQSTVPGEETAETQPFPVLPKALTRQTAVKADEAWGIDEEDKAWCRAEISKLRSDGIFTPPTVSGSLFTPGNVGGLAWGGFGFDPQQHLLLVPSNNLPSEFHLVPRALFNNREQRGREIAGDWEFTEQNGTPYGLARRFLLSPKRIPCVAPPWGMLTAIDADTGEQRWQVPLGQWLGLDKIPESEKWGSLNLGGPLVTAGGVTFMAGTLDPAMRVFETATGKLLYKAKLPASARSTPMTFLGPDGHQYVLVAAGGHGISGQPLVDTLVAFRVSATSTRTF